jgi:hypothetical protein
LNDILNRVSSFVSFVGYNNSRKENGGSPQKVRIRF